MVVGVCPFFQSEEAFNVVTFRVFWVESLEFWIGGLSYDEKRYSTIFVRIINVKFPVIRIFFWKVQIVEWEDIEV